MHSELQSPLPAQWVSSAASHNAGDVLLRRASSNARVMYPERDHSMKGATWPLGTDYLWGFLIIV